MLTLRFIISYILLHIYNVEFNILLENVTVVILLTWNNYKNL